MAYGKRKVTGVESSLETEDSTVCGILYFSVIPLAMIQPYPVLGPAAAAVSQGVGKQQAVASRRQVEHPLSNDKAHPEKNVTGRQKRDHQQHQTQGQCPGRERERERSHSEDYIHVPIHPSLLADNRRPPSHIAL